MNIDNECRGSRMVQRLALLPHSMKVLVLCPCGSSVFFTQSKNMHISLAVDSKLSVVVSANGCLCVCVIVVVNRQPVRDVPRDG